MFSVGIIEQRSGPSFDLRWRHEIDYHGIPSRFRGRPEGKLTDEIAETVMFAIENLPDPDDPTPSWDFAQIN
jgi:hypothetical protein